MTDMIFNFLEFLHKLDKIDRIRQNWTFKCLFRLACVSRDIYITSSKIFGFLSITFWWTRLNFQFLGLICLHNILPEHEAASDRSQGSPCWGCCVSVWSPAGRAGRSRKEERIRGRWPAVPSLAWDSLGVGCRWPAQKRSWGGARQWSSVDKPVCTTECRFHLGDRYFRSPPPRSPGPHRWSSSPPWPSGRTCRSGPVWRRPRPLSSAVSHWQKWEVCWK